MNIQAQDHQIKQALCTNPVAESAESPAAQAKRVQDQLASQGIRAVARVAEDGKSLNVKRLLID